MSWTASSLIPSTVLYYRAGLDEEAFHTLNLTNNAPNTELALSSYVILTTNPSSVTSHLDR